MEPSTPPAALMRRALVRAMLLCALALGLAACGSSAAHVRLDDDSPTPGLRTPDGELPDMSRRPTREVRGAEVRGDATWYGDRHHGNLTANGETFDVRKFTAAHRTLPFNTVVRVVDTATSRTVVVRINDRGPRIKSRVIDLSKAAAADLGIIRRGVAKVRLEILAWGDGARYHHGRKTLPGKKRRKKGRKRASRD